MRKQSFHCNQKQRSSIAYFAQYRNTLPQDISNRLSIPFSPVSQTFQIRFLGSTYWVTHPDFRIQYLSGGNGVQSLCSSSDAQHLLLHYFIDGDHQETVGAFLPVQALPWDSTSVATFQRRCTDRLAHSYGNRPDTFQAVMESLLGIRQAYGDISYDIELINDLFLRLILWKDQDQPKAEILFSDNFLTAFYGSDWLHIGEVVLQHMTDYEKLWSDIP